MIVISQHMRGVKDWSNNFRRTPHFFQLVLLGGLLLLLPVVTLVAQQVVKLRSQAGAAASLSLMPQSVSLAQGQSQPFSLILNANTNLMSFVHIELMFDRTKIQLADVGTPILTTSQLQRKVQVTDKATANSNGKITLALGLDPEATPPTGTFELANLPFTVVSTTVSDTTDIIVVDANALLVNQDANPVSLTIPTAPAQLTLNELIVASPQLTASPSPVASTPTPAPSASDNNPPSVTITNPLNGAIVTRNSTITIAANASDNVRVTKVEFRVGGKLLCTDTTSGYTCTWNISGKPNANYSLEAKAYDETGNSSTYRVNVTSSNQ